MKRDRAPKARRATGLRAGARPSDYARRDFLKAGGLAGLALGLPGLAGCGEPGGSGRAPARQPLRKTLGRTGVEVPDVAFGTFSLDGDIELVRYALDRGITHFDTAEGYQEGRSEETLGKALAADRSRVTVTTKIVAEPDASAPGLMKRLEGSLRRLGTDYVDFYLNHAVDDPARMANPGWSEFVEQAKAQGKIRFSGMSGHGPGLVGCLEAALEAGQLDAILVAYNYIQSPDFLDAARATIQRQLGMLDWVALQPDLPRFLERAKEAGVGVMTMKTLRGGRHNDLRPFEQGGATFAQAALRWVLSDPRVDAAVISMTSRELVDEYLGAAGGGRPTGEDLALLSRYEALNRDRQCVLGCSACADTCPNDVPISDVLRIGMYQRDYGLPEIAASEYAALAVNGAACVGCSVQTCAGACPTGLSIPARTRATHEALRPANDAAERV